ncbi:MAG TPA: Crp/Fnr family transcriptional regulator [Burkholderiales bacterium]|jgi:CRP-like cAMP-binding protein|nr:Crp/Fnr family transcriptional regulator [Burkholderiales bacterium]
MTQPKPHLRDPALLQGVIQQLGMRWALTPAQAAALGCRSWLRADKRGTLVVRRGTRLPGLLVVAYGTIKLGLGRAAGEERLLRFITAGQLFGEATALLGRPCPYEALALTDSKIAVVPAAAVLALMEDDARFARRFALMLAERIHELVGEFEVATTQRGAQRLASYLESLCTGAAGAPYTVNLPISKTLVAARLGMKKETLSRLLRQFCTERLIDVCRREVSVLDRARLAEVARTS